MFRKFAAWTRRRIEGLACLILLPLVMAVSLAGLLRRRADRRVFSCTARRWSRFILHGLKDLRSLWWPQLNLEPARNVWRYVLLLEWAEWLNMARPQAQRQGAASRYLVYVPGHLGDLLHAVPLLRALRRHLPDAEIFLLAGPWCDALSTRIPHVSRVISYAPHMLQFYRGNSAHAWPVYREARLLSALRRMQPDVLMTTVTTDLPALLLGQAVRPALWAGFQPHPDLYSRCSRAMFIQKDTREMEADALMRLLPACSLQPGDASLEYAVQGPEADAALRLLAEAGVASGQPCVVMAPGAGWAGKVWPAERFAEVAIRVSGKHGLKTILLGSPEEAGLGAQIARAAGGCAVNLAGRTSLPVSAAVIQRARLLLCNDSGLLHIAAALGVPTVSLFGPTRPEKWAPRGPKHIALRAVEGCPDCYPWHPRAVCRHDRACMKAISVERVCDAIARLLRS